MNYIWSESTQWLQSSGIHKIPGALIVPMWVQRANDHDVAHLKAKTILINLIWSESAQWLLSFGTCNIPGQDSSNELDSEWIGSVVAEFQCPQDTKKPLLHQWSCPYANYHDVAYV